MGFTSLVPPPMTADTKTFLVPAELDGARLDRALVQLATGLSRARVKRAIDEGAVRVDGRPRAKGAIVAQGEVISIEGAASDDGATPPEPDASAPLVVLYESAQVVVVAKPAGEPTVPLKPRERGTTVNALLGRYPEMARFGHNPREPGVVHRLDTETSGALVAARTEEAFEELRVALKDEALEKTYLLVCSEEGLADEGRIDFPLANHPKDQRRVYACIHPRDVMRYQPRPASTSYRVVRRRGPWALVEATVHRALRHQLRVHFAAIEHPLAGDELYGGPAAEGLGRHALHASGVRYAGGPAVEAFAAEAPLPEDMARLVGAS